MSPTLPAIAGGITGAGSSGAAPTPILLPTRAMRSACPLASRCTCVFQQVSPVNIVSAGGTALHDEIATWTELGYAVVRSDAAGTTLERRRLLGFCVNFALTVLTGSLWLLYWVPRIRNPRFDVIELAPAADGAVATTHTHQKR